MNVYFDVKGSFFLKLVQGSQNGFKLEDWMNTLYVGNNKDCYTPNTKDRLQILEDGKIKKGCFPCVIVIKKDFFKSWMSYLDKYRTRLKGYLKVCGKFNPHQGFLPSYISYIEAELKRVDELYWKIKQYQNNYNNHLFQQFSLLNNSSIWIRLVNWDKEAISHAINEFKYFKKIGLYEYASAWENFEYNFHIQENNYLSPSEGGHGYFVTPLLYGSESEALELLTDNKVLLDEN